MVKTINYIWFGGKIVVQKNNVQYNKFICEFYRELNKKMILKSNIVFLCIGTDRITGDCFGPLVGEKLKRNNFNLNVYGTLENPISAVNLEDEVKKINLKFNKPCIIAIDAALSNKENIGKIVVSNSFLKAGSVMKSEYIKVGDISIRGIIGKKEKTLKKNIDVLQNTPLNLVINMAKLVSIGVIEVMQERKLKIFK